MKLSSGRGLHITLLIFYFFQTFALRAGVHTVHFTQMKKNFRFSHVSLLPKELHTWVPLGIQNRFIPDSFLSAFPPTGRPDPKFARLNGYGKLFYLHAICIYILKRFVKKTLIYIYDRLIHCPLAQF